MIHLYELNGYNIALDVNSGCIHEVDKETYAVLEYLRDKIGEGIIFDGDKEKLVKELEKTEEEIRTLYLDYRNEILDEEDYKKFYEEKANQKNRLKKEIEILDKEKETKPVLSEEKLNELVLEIMNMKGIKKDIISEIIYDIQIDNDNNIYINYKYDIFNVA